MLGSKTSNTPSNNRQSVEPTVVLGWHQGCTLVQPGAEIVGKTPHRPAADYKDRISDLEKRLEAAVEEHRRMRRELEALEDRDPYQILIAKHPLPHLDDDARN